ncbi:MAG TPA: MBL fold metallo-hydrolase [Planctomycetaceae bacterium]|nr:MBL fold metallo-hydrolase [Planctomycetaceae bacterium]
MPVPIRSQPAAATNPSAREMILLGTGTSVGVPVIGCDCAVCTSSDPRNNRTRTGVAVGAPAGTFVIDTPPELRLQLVREKIPLVHAAVYTHSHADHIFGLDDLRICGHRLDRPIPLYCEEAVEQQLRMAYHYAFAPPDPGAHQFAVPKLEFRRIGLEPFELLGQTVRPIRLLHGRLAILGFRLNDVAFCTDVSAIPEESWPLLAGLDVLVLDALRDTPHPTHLSIAQAIEVVERVRPRQTYFTHISHSLDHAATNARLPNGVALAYDGLRIPL